METCIPTGRDRLFHGLEDHLALMFCILEREKVSLEAKALAIDALFVPFAALLQQFTIMMGEPAFRESPGYDPMMMWRALDDWVEGFQKKMNEAFSDPSVHHTRWLHTSMSTLTQLHLNRLKSTLVTTMKREQK